MELPDNPMMLLSVVNTKLRDEYSSLDALCEDMHVERKELEQKLATMGYEYNPITNRFW